MIREIHHPHDFFEYFRVADSEPAPATDRIDVAVLDMNHSWPNVGHDAVVHAILEAAERWRDTLVEAGTKVRVLSYDVRRTLLLPAPDGRFQLYLATGGPGHLDPRANDGVTESSQGIREDPSWEAPLFRLFDAIAEHRDAALVGICHSFGLMCRWSGAARPVLREEKSSGVPSNVLSDAGVEHPWFSRFSRALADGRHFRVVDNRLFDLIVEDPSAGTSLAFDSDNASAVTMIEFARDATGTMPRVFGVNHHPEIIDREHVLAVLEEKRTHREVSDRWYRERAAIMSDLLEGESERQSRLTSEYTLLEPLRHHLGRIVAERCSVSSRA
jgi:hypothetical protein